MYFCGTSGSFSIRYQMCKKLSNRFILTMIDFCFRRISELETVFSYPEIDFYIIIIKRISCTIHIFFDHINFVNTIISRQWFYKMHIISCSECWISHGHNSTSEIIIDHQFSLGNMSLSFYQSGSSCSDNSIISSFYFGN